MSNDRELTELAAKAAGLKGGWQEAFQWMKVDNPEATGLSVRTVWHPLTDDGDALRLSVKLKLDVFTGQGARGDITTVSAPPEHDIESCGERHGDDPHAATRLAIVRAAAEIAKAGD